MSQKINLKFLLVIKHLVDNQKKKVVGGKARGKEATRKTKT
jgi:hypothetical protein